VRALAQEQSPALERLVPVEEQADLEHAPPTMVRQSSQRRERLLFEKTRSAQRPPIMRGNVFPPIDVRATSMPIASFVDLALVDAQLPRDVTAPTTSHGN
jgi:hypothetical protein